MMDGVFHGGSGDLFLCHFLSFFKKMMKIGLNLP